MSEISSWVQSLPFLWHRIPGQLSCDTRVSEGSNRIRFLVVTATGTECRLPTQEFDSVVVANDRLSLRGYVIFPYSPIMRFCVSALTNHDGTYLYIERNMFAATMKAFPSVTRPGPPSERRQTLGPEHVMSRDKQKHDVWSALEAQSTSQHHWSHQTYVTFNRMKHSDSKIRNRHLDRVSDDRHRRRWVQVHVSTILSNPTPRYAKSLRSGLGRSQL